MLSTTALSVLALALSARAQQVITINVGGTAGLMFSPDQATAAVGDTLHFVFGPTNHSVIQTSLDDPCTLLPKGGFDSGFQPVADGGAQPTFDVVVNSTETIWVASGQLSECEAGMVFAANANSTSDKNFAKFQANALALGNNTLPMSMTMSGMTDMPMSTGPAATASAAIASTTSGASSLFRAGWQSAALAALGVASVAVLSL